MAAALDELDADADLRVGVITGAGKGFCAGMDLKAFVRGESPHVEGRGFAGIAQRASRKPLIAAIEGFAVAGGFEVALACDLIVAAEGAKLGIPEVKRCLVAAAGALLRLPQPHPLPRGDGAGADRRSDPAPSAGPSWAWSTGWPSRAARSTPRSSWPRPSPPTGRWRSIASKRILVESAGWSEDEAWQRQGEIAGPVFGSEDAREGATAFAEKRDPVWKGR